MWEVFALTSLIFAALGMVEYRKGKQPSYRDMKPKEEVRISQPVMHEEKEPQKFIKLRFGNEKDEKQLNEPNIQISSNQRYKDEAKRIWENHYIVKAVKERFAKGEERNYGVFTSEKDNSSVSKKLEEVSHSQSEVTTSLPVLSMAKDPQSVNENTEERSNTSLHSGVFGSLLRERQNSELNLVNDQETAVKREDKKGEEFNPFDVLGGL